MREGWKEVDIQSIALKVTSGGTPLRKMSEYYGGSIPWVKTKQVNYNRIYDSEEYLTELGLQNSSAKLIPENSIIIAMYGDGNTAGRCAINKVPVTTNQACCNIIIDQNLADYNFIYYYLSTQYDKLVSLKSGAGQQNLNAQTIKEFVINLPPLETQKKIASILSGYDDLIENNLKRIKILEEMAQQTYEEWFVRMRFPGHESATINSETGLAEGWEKVKLGDVISFKVDNRGKNPSYYTNEGIPVLDNHLITNSPFVDLTKASRFLDEALFENFIRRYLEKDDVLITLVGTVANITLAPKERCAIVQNTIGLRCNEKCKQTYLYQFLKNNKQTILNNNRGSAQPSVKVGDLLAIDFLLPPSKLINEYDKYCSLIFEKIQNLGYQNQRLREARDILLPRLMMGMVEV